MSWHVMSRPGNDTVDRRSERGLPLPRMIWARLMYFRLYPLCHCLFHRLYFFWKYEDLVAAILTVYQVIHMAAKNSVGREVGLRFRGCGSPADKPGFLRDAAIEFQSIVAAAQARAGRGALLADVPFLVRYGLTSQSQAPADPGHAVARQSIFSGWR